MPYSLKKLFDGIRDGPDLNDASLLDAVEMSIVRDQDSSSMKTSCSMDGIRPRSRREEWFALENILLRLFNNDDFASNKSKKSVRPKLEGVSFIFRDQDVVGNQIPVAFNQPHEQFSALRLPAFGGSYEEIGINQELCISFEQADLPRLRSQLPADPGPRF